jgi:hypothetical protein
MFDEGVEILLEFSDPCFASKRFTVTKKREDHIGFGVRQLKSILTYFALVSSGKFGDLGAWGAAAEPLILSTKVHRSMTLGWIAKTIDLVAAVGHVAENEFVIGKSSLDQRFEPTKVLHSLGHRPTQDADMIPFFEFQFSISQGCRNENQKEATIQRTQKQVHARDSLGESYLKMLMLTKSLASDDCRKDQKQGKSILIKGLSVLRHSSLATRWSFIRQRVIKSFMETADSRSNQQAVI